MAKAKGGSKSGSSQKVQLNTKKKGKAKKSYGPKENRPKLYKGQGR
jgi:hypothetical protein